jgi:hypothetical protein
LAEKQKADRACWNFNFITPFSECGYYEKNDLCKVIERKVA